MDQFKDTNTKINQRAQVYVNNILQLNYIDK